MTKRRIEVRDHEGRVIKVFMPDEPAMILPYTMTNLAVAGVICFSIGAVSCLLL